MRHGRHVTTALVGVLLALASAGNGGVSGAPPAGDRLQEVTLRHVGGSFDELRELLAIPNDAHHPEQVEANLVWARAAFEKRGFATRALRTAGPPLLLAERAVAGASRTVLAYLHLDGQPVDAPKWDQPSPFDPTLKILDDGRWRALEWSRLKAADRDPEWRVFARSASDAKGPVAMLLAALSAASAEKLTQPFHLKVIMDFEEELGSPHLLEAVRAHREALAADALIILDGPRHLSNRPTLCFGARGIASVTLTVFGPRVALHSGHYGNYAPNPAIRLARLIASMKDDHGRVTIPGYYDGISLDAEARAVLAQVPDDEPRLRETLGFAEPEQVAATYQEALQYPSLNLRGMASGWIGDEARTIVPSSATAEIDLRLPPESDAERLIGLIRSHVEAQGYHVASGPPSDEERLGHPRIAAFVSRVEQPGFRTPLDSEVGAWLQRALVRAFGEEPIRQRMWGGSVPIAPFIQELGVAAVAVPTVNADNNQHGPNENLRVGNYLEGVTTLLAILTEPLESR